MSVKEKRNVTFEVPESKPGCNGHNNISNNNNRCNGKSANKDDSLSRSRARSRSWSRFRARRAKSQDSRPAQDSGSTNYGSQVGGKRERSLVSLMRTGSRNSVRSLVKIFEIRSMNEGRKSQIVLLDERRLDIIIQPKLYSNELLDLVASHFKLKEKQYFGLGFLDETNHFNWLQGEKRVLDHEFPKKTGLLVLHFAIKFYVDTIGLLRDIQTVELFYLNARQLLFRGHLECDTETVFELAAHVLQATNGDFVSEEETREELKKLPVIPTCTLKEHPSIAFCEDRVIQFYEKINGTSRGLAIVNYMTIVEKIPTYGIHYYDVKDKKDIPWWLGISPKGIAVYDKNDKTTPRKLFTWKNLENLYYRDRKFSIEVHGPKRDETGSQVSVSRRTFGASNVDVHAWFASTPQLTKCIWSMAVVQHQFYLDRKQSRSQLTTARSMSEIAADLCRSTTSLPGSLGSDLSRSPSSHSLPSLSNSRYDLTIEQSDSLKAERDMYQALKARREALEESLRKKTEELKLLCLQEGELTGELPNDFPLSLGEQPPVFRRRVGTAFSLTVKSVQDTDQLSTELSKLELEVELQGKITAAAHKLASDKTVSKYVRKQRRQSYTKAFGKLKDMEKKLDDMRKKMRKSSSDHQAGRSMDGMYPVVHPHSQCDLDFDQSISVLDLSDNIQDDSCGSSGNISDLSGGRDTSFYPMLYMEHKPDGYDDYEIDVSSGYYSPSASSLVSRSHQMITGSSSLSRIPTHTSSSEDILATKSDTEICAGDVGATSRNAPNLIKAEDQNIKHVHTGRKKHFIIRRGQNNRLTELQDDTNRAKSHINNESKRWANSRTATPECDHDTDSTFDNSFTGDISQNDSKEDKQKLGTRVQRREQTFIACRGIMNDFHLETPKHVGFEKGWKKCEQILTGNDSVPSPKVGNRYQLYKSTLQHESVAQEQINPFRGLRKGEAELRYATQKRVNRNEKRTSVRRSRSFDHKHNVQLSESTRCNNTGQSEDDLKLVKVSPQANYSTLKKPKAFIFISKRQNNPNHLQNFVSEVQSPSLNRRTPTTAAPHFDISANKVHMDQSCLNGSC